MYKDKQEITEHIKDKAKKVKLVIFDMDGVLTNGLCSLTASGEISKTFNYQDGLGIALLQANKIDVAIITGDQSGVVDERAKRLKIKYVYKGRISKLSAYKDLKGKLNLNDEQIAYMGDDIIDIPVMKEVGLSIAVQNAQNAVKEIADYVTPLYGGEGAARELCDLILSFKKLDPEALVETLEKEISSCK
ncbi:MAG: HAD-IIIA family hydrolase [Bdellovibrionaceae bacterium]|nr:HAD-IIIA family hydrolase [Pseudobdellovibrionaceae bacterium]